MQPEIKMKTENKQRSIVHSQPFDTNTLHHIILTKYNTYKFHTKYK